MEMSEPDDLRWDEDLLSGYLDGELSEPQERFVRERLAIDPAARDLLRRLREQREQMLRSHDAIPPIDLSRRIAERIAPVDRTVSPQRSSDAAANGSRSAWRFAAALLAASLAGILIGPWFLRSRTEVTMQSPASQSSSARWDAAESGEFESASRADGLAGKPIDNLPTRQMDARGMAGVSADRLWESMEAAPQAGEKSGPLQGDRAQSQDGPADRYLLNRSDPAAVPKDATSSEMSNNLNKPEALGFAIDQEDGARFAAGRAASGVPGEPVGPGGGGGLGAAGGRGGMASGGRGAGAAPGDLRKAAPGAVAEGSLAEGDAIGRAGMGRASGRAETRGLAAKDQRESMPAPADAVAGKSKELKLSDAELLRRESKEDERRRLRAAGGSEVLGERASMSIDGLFRVGGLELERWQELRSPTDPEWTVQLTDGIWLLDVPAFFWPTLYQRMIRAGWSIEESGQEVVDAEGGGAADGRLSNPRMPRVDNPQSVELGQGWRIWFRQENR
jgi:hypothetical protein